MGCGGSPTLPDYAQQSRDAVQANLEAFPTQYMVNNAAQLGIPVTINGQTYDFSGRGDAQTAGQISDQMAQALLDIQQNYSPAFIQQRLAELQAADPQGYAARKQLFDQILSDSQQQPNRPMAQGLQDQVMNLLNQNGQLDARQLQEVQQQSRGGQVARGNFLGNAATEQEANNVVNAAQGAQDQNQQAALQFLQSGVSPEDVAYRRLQQSLGNLSSFVNGQTPSAEFGSLSGAQSGIVPFTTTGTNQASVDMNAAQQGAARGLQLYGGQINWAQSQTNPWLAGLSTGASSLGALSSLGWNPYTSGASGAGFNWGSIGGTTQGAGAGTGEGWP